jgi:hypothetical protein
MSDIAHSRLYYINSVSRISGTSSDFTFNIPNLFNDRFTHACVLQATIPMSFYLIRKGINVFTLTENGTNVNITFPIGNYNYIDFMSKLTTLLNTNSPNLWVYAITFDKVTAKFTYTVTGNSSQPSFSFTSHLAQQFGFNYPGTVTFSGNKLDSANVVTFVPESSLFIHSDLVDDGINQGILQEIYSSNVVPFSNITYELTTDVKAYSKRIVNPNSHSFRFTIQDEDNNIVDTNGQNTLITLLLYREDNFKEMFKTYIKYLVAKDNGPDIADDQTS